MRIEIELPDWCEEKHIFVIAGSECVAVKHADEDEVYIKTERCKYYNGEKCNHCCEVAVYGKPCPDLYEGGCKLVKRPLMCCIDHPKQMLKNHPNCAMRYKVINKKEVK